MLLKINPANIDPRLIKTVVEVLKNDGVIIYPTDTVYAMGCNIYSNKAIEKICRIKNVKSGKSNFSFICSDLSHISDFTKPFERSVYKLMNRCLPGPFTFILNANSAVPTIFKNHKKTIGIRIARSLRGICGAVWKIKRCEFWNAHEISALPKPTDNLVDSA